MRIVSLIVLCSLCFQFLFKTGVAGYYFANKAYIAKVLCINRENKEMHCDGKCYLKKKMQEAGEETPQAATRIKYEPVEFLTVSGAVQHLYPPAAISLVWGFPIDPYSLLHSSSVFHPPC